MGDVPVAIRRQTLALAAQLSDYDRQLSETERACGCYSAQLRYLELQPDIERSRHGLERLRQRATELGPAIRCTFDELAAAGDPDRWRPTEEDLHRVF
jgi:hypothetical protein